MPTVETLSAIRGYHHPPEEMVLLTAPCSREYISLRKNMALLAEHAFIGSNAYKHFAPEQGATLVRAVASLLVLYRFAALKKSAAVNDFYTISAVGFSLFVRSRDRNRDE